MKEILATILCVLLIMVFVVQMTANQATHNKLIYVERAINASVEIAKEDGYFTDENLTALLSKIAAKVGCSDGEITYLVTQTQTERGGMIEYEFKIPVKGVIAAGGFLGFDSSSNKIVQTISGSTMSEFVKR